MYGVNLKRNTVMFYFSESEIEGLCLTFIYNVLFML